MRQRLILSREHDESGRAVLIGAALFTSFLERVSTLQRREVIARGVLLSPADARGREHPPVEACFFGEEGEEGFEPGPLAALKMRARRNRRVMVAPFRSQPTPPARFSMSGYVPHTPRFRWHLVIGRREGLPAVQPFMFDERDGELLAQPVLLLVEGERPELLAVERLMSGEIPRRRAGNARRVVDVGAS